MNVGNVLKFMRLGRHSVYAMGKIRSLVDAHSQALEGLKAEPPKEGSTGDQYLNSMGSWTFPTGGGGGGGGGTWSGVVWYLGELKWDYSRTDADPAGEPLAGGISIGGIYLRIKLENGDATFSDAVNAGLAPTHNYYCVGYKRPDETYGLATNRTVGDIRIDMVPFTAPIDAEDE